MLLLLQQPLRRREKKGRDGARGTTPARGQAEPKKLHRRAFPPSPPSPSLSSLLETPTARRTRGPRAPAAP